MEYPEIIQLFAIYGNTYEYHLQMGPRRRLVLVEESLQSFGVDLSLLSCAPYLKCLQRY